ncbi:helix-turn-helix domain-containing protein [Enterococcus cecorum]|uniref:helix-turn-helix domain-containing protein n=1 Tax=Enterococcus cecorum TaxID=44008 RepID=UPI0032C4472B
MNRIREYRRKNNLTTTELGELIGLSQSTISKIENGQTSPKVEWLEKMADVFGCTVNDLLGREERFPRKQRKYDTTTFEPYYKLHYSFFNSREYKVLTVYCDYEEIVAFLIMQSYSTKNKGVINYDHTAGLNISEELALDTELDFEVVKSTLEAAKAARLIEITNEQIVFLDVQKQFNRKQNE